MRHDTDALAEANRLAELIAASLPVKIEIAALTLKSKIPFKALSLRELVIHRVSALATPAVELFEQGRLVPALVLTRAVVESVAVAYSLHKQTKAFLQSHDVKSFDEFLMKGLMGSRVSDTGFQSTNVITLVDHVEKEIPGFRQSYDSLSEYAHPNWAGVLGMFGRVDRGTFELILGQNERTAGFSIGVSVLSGTLLTFYHFYNDMVNMLYQLNDYFENTDSVA